MKDDCLERWLLLALLAAAGILAVVTVPADPLVLLTAFVGWGLVLVLLLGALGAMLRAVASILLVIGRIPAGARRLAACARHLVRRLDGPRRSVGGPQP